MFPAIQLHPTILALTLFGCTMFAVAPGCTDADEPSETTRSAEPVPHTVALELSLDEDTAMPTVEAIARSAETLAGPELSGARIRVEKVGDGTMILAVELWGAELATGDTIVSKLRAERPELADTPIAIREHDGPPADEPIRAADLDDDETPEQTKARVIEQLRAKGVTGELTVDVIDEDQGRRVEVRVEDPKPAEPSQAG